MNESQFIIEMDKLLTLQMSSIRRSIEEGDGKFMYLRGVYNGLEAARQTVTKDSCVFVDENGCLEDKPKQLQMERFE